MVINPVVVIHKLAQFLGDMDEKEMLRQIDVPSSSTFLSDADTQRFLRGSEPQNDRLYLINKWRSRISVEEENQAFEILQRFGIDLYGPGEDLPIHRLNE
jgi:hypothetical protein